MQSTKSHSQQPSIYSKTYTEDPFYTRALQGLFPFRIAAILGSIDEKIELNRKKIAELEALAKTIYDYWFVQFDFPDKNGKPYKSSGGKMVWNEQLKREIQDGWEVVTFTSLIAKVANTRRLTTNEYELAGTFPIVDQSEEFIAGYTTDSSAVLDLYKCVVFGDHSCTVKLVNFPFCRGADGTQIILSNDESSVSTYQLYQFMKHLKFDGQYKRHFSFLKQHLVPIKLDLALGDKFNNVVEPIFNSIRNCRKNIMSLIQVRDTLIPLLMNGQVEVK
jgi:type I restriction enzyme S subunit